MDTPSEHPTRLICRHCEQISWILRRVSWNFAGGNLVRFTDGRIHGLPVNQFIDDPIVFACAHCHVLDRVDRCVSPVKVTLWRSLCGIRSFRPLVTQSIEICLEALGRASLLVPGDDWKLRSAIVRLGNDPIRSMPDRRKIKYDRRSQDWRRAVEPLITDYRPTELTEIATAAEVARELGDHDLALEIIERDWQCDEGLSWHYGVSEIKRLAQAGNSWVQEAWRAYT